MIRDSSEDASENLVDLVDLQEGGAGSLIIIIFWISRAARSWRLTIAGRRVAVAEPYLCWCSIVACSATHGEKQGEVGHLRG